MRVFLERANTLSKQYDNTPVVISGDLNSTPKVVYLGVIHFLIYCALDLMKGNCY